MDSEKVKEIICNAVKTTEPTWSTWGVHWKELDEVFLSRAYDQLGFDDWIFVNFLRDNDILSIKKIGSILDNGCFERRYDREIASGLEMPFYIFLKKGVFGKEGRKELGFIILLGILMAVKELLFGNYCGKCWFAVII